MPNAVTWGYATLRWTHHVNKSGIPQQRLLQALMSFDLVACYLILVRPEHTAMERECWDTIKRVAFPPRHYTVISNHAKDL